MRHGNFCYRDFAFGVSTVLGECKVAFEFKGWAVTESGVEALGIVDGVNEDANGAFCVFDVPESAAIDFFGFEGLHEALCFGVVVRVARSAHADRNFVAGEALAIFGRRVLHATVGMMNETGRFGLSIGKSLIECFHGERRIEIRS